MVSMSHTAPNKFEIAARSQLLKSYVSEHCLEDLTPQEALSEALEDPDFAAQVANVTSLLIEREVVRGDDAVTLVPQPAGLLSEEDVQRSAQMVADAVTRAGELELKAERAAAEPIVPIHVQMRNIWNAIKTAVQLQWVEHDRQAAQAQADAKKLTLARERNEQRRQDASRRLKDRYFGRNGCYIRPR